MDFKQFPSYKTYKYKSVDKDGRELIFSHNYLYIYSITDLKSGKKYIGRTKNPQKRFENHYRTIKYKYHKCPEMNECDVDDLVFEILEENVKFEDRFKEKFYMEKFKTYLSEYGFNTRDTYFQNYTR